MSAVQSRPTRGKPRTIVVPRVAVQTLGERMVVYLPVKNEEGKFIQREIRVSQPIGDGGAPDGGRRGDRGQLFPAG